MRFSPDPVPSSVPADLAEYLDRQFNQIANASDASFIAPVLYSVPERLIPGGVVYVVDDGFYVCASVASGGDVAWRKVQI